MIGPMTDMQTTYAYVRSLYEVAEVAAVQPVTVTNTNDDVDLAKTPASVKGFHKKATLLGWTIGLRQTTTHHPALYLLSDGAKLKVDGTKSLKGDLKTAAKDVVHTFMWAVDPTRKIGFQASWKAGTFEDALVRDPYGIPTELFFDYTVDAISRKRLGDERAKNLEEVSDWAYNDGESYLAKTKLLTTTTEFDGWISDWLSLSGLDVVRAKPRVKKVKPVAAEVLAENDAALLVSGEWSAG